MAKAAFQRERSLGYRVNLAGRLLARALDRRLAHHGVALGQFPILLTLWEEENLTQSEIARRLDIEQPTVANTLKRMARDGLVTTARDPDNARHVLFRLTDRGRALEPAVTTAATEVNGNAARDLSADELDRFHVLLGRVIRALGGASAL